MLTIEDLGDLIERASRVVGLTCAARAGLTVLQWQTHGGNVRECPELVALEAWASRAQEGEGHATQ